MPKPSDAISARALIIAFSALCAAPSYAYLDPGTGSILVQGILAAVAAVAVAAKLYWGRIKSFFVQSKPPSVDEATEADDVATESGRRDPD